MPTTLLGTSLIFKKAQITKAIGLPVNISRFLCSWICSATCFFALEQGVHDLHETFSNLGIQGFNTHLAVSEDSSDTVQNMATFCLVNLCRG